MAENFPCFKYLLYLCRNKRRKFAVLKTIQTNLYVKANESKRFL